MRRIFFAIVFVFASLSTALPSTTDPMAAVRQYVDDFNKGDLKAMAATCAVPASIIDGLPPHVWQGPTACEDYYRDVMATGEIEGATDYFVTLSKTRHIDVTRDRAYVVVPATMTFKYTGSRLSNRAQSLQGRFASSPKGGA
jgi:hypothetical protein